MLDVLIDRPRILSAYARTPLQILKIRVDPWFELLEDSFELARTSVLGLARAVAALEERLWATGRTLSEPTPLVLGATGAPLDIVERLAVLMHMPPLRSAGVQPVSDLAAASEEVVFSTGERLFERGVARERIFVLIDGRVEASRESPRVSWRGGPGQMVCGTVSFAEAGSHWEARAVTRTRALAFGIDDWFDVMEENFEMVRATLAALAVERERLVGAL
jgi:CRP-like cAMP-binding protein